MGPSEPNTKWGTTDGIGDSKSIAKVSPGDTGQDKIQRDSSYIQGGEKCFHLWAKIDLFN